MARVRTERKLLVTELRGLRALGIYDGPVSIDPQLAQAHGDAQVYSVEAALLCAILPIICRLTD